MTRLEWTDGGWQYSIVDEGAAFRFRAYFPCEPKPIDLDLGLIPGGIYVAIEKLVKAREAA